MKKTLSIALATLLAGCGSNDDRKKSDWIYMNFCREPTTHDSRKSTEMTTTFLADLLNEGLMKVKPDGRIVPAQAERVEISQDGLTYTFYLRQNIFWSNGDPVTAEDFVLSWKKCLSPEFFSPRAFHFYPIKNAKLAKMGLVPLDHVGLEVVNAKTLRVTLEEPNSTFLALITSTFAAPMRYKNDKETDPTNLLCNGPFYISKWKEGEKHKKVQLKRNPFYPSTSYPMKGIEISLIEDQNTAFQLFEQRQLDFVGATYSPISPTTFDAIAEKRLDESISQHAVSVSVCNFNTGRFPLNNRNIRRALSYAIDREMLATAFKAHRFTPAYSIVPDGFKNTSYQTFPKDNAELAKQYFAEGLKELDLAAEKFPKLKLLYPLSSENVIIQKIAQILQQNLREVLGVDIILETYDLKTAIANLVKKEFDLGLTLWSADYPHPISFLSRFLEKGNPKNYSGWENQEFKETITRAQYSRDRAKEMQAIIHAEQILAEEVPATPVLFWNFTIFPDERIEGIEIDQTGKVHFENVRIKNPGASENAPGTNIGH